jgi:RNA polymerase sigma factor (sigma-70 family)
VKTPPQITTSKLKTSPLYDTEVWEAFRIGNQAAFQQIYSHYVRILFSYGGKLTTDYTLVEDCVHDLFVELWDRRTYLGKTSSIKLYLFKGLKRKIVRKLIQQKNTIYTENDHACAFGITSSYETSLVREQLSEEQHQKLIQAIAKLTDRQREVLFLRFHANMNYEEIARLLSLNYQSVSNIIFRAMKTLRTEMSASPATSSFPLYIVLLLFLA